jgi:hypothetical protein
MDLAAELCGPVKRGVERKLKRAVRPPVKAARCGQSFPSAYITGSRHDRGQEIAVDFQACFSRGN